MRVVVDIECNRLKNPDKIWVICCKNIDTGEMHVFKENERLSFGLFSRDVSLWIGHNFLGFDYPILYNLGYIGHLDPALQVIDTYILSKLVDFPREKHSIEDYGLEFQFPKGTYSDWSKYSPEMEEYCKRDVDICHKIFLKYIKVIEDKKWKDAIALENKFQLVCNLLNKNGFYFNVDKAQVLLSKVQTKLEELDKDILEAFPPTQEFIKRIRKNKDGTIHRTDIRYFDNTDLFTVTEDCVYRKKEFNPASHKQLIDVLHTAGWAPADKTKTHIDWLRDRKKVVDKEKKIHYDKYGWKINETNLLSLPISAPRPARTLAQRILYESRRRTLTEWLTLVSEDDGRIHGDFQGIGAWTHRMSHQRPNTANIPNELDDQGRIKLLGGDLRQLWGAPKGRLLVGCDAEGIQLRIFAHYIDDPEFTKEVSDGDPHSLNKAIMGEVCKHRQAAKRFIYALLLGAGMQKLGEILEASPEETKYALDRIMERYTGFKYLKEHVFPRDIRRGWFVGLDGRKVLIPKVSERPHLVMSGYLQNGEALVIKRAAILTIDKLLLNKKDAILVDIVHDEYQWEVPNNMDEALFIAKANADSIKEAGEYYNLKCPLSGSYFNKKKNDYTIATNWRLTH
jgi:DNA polymerase-1